MTRNIIVAISLLAFGALLAGFVIAQAPGIPFKSSGLTVDGIDPKHFEVNRIEGTFAFRGLPVLQAVLPKKHVKLSAARIEGTFDLTTRAVETAKLTGGVKGTLDSPAKEGTEHRTFSGSTVNYKNAGGADEESADLEVFSGVEFGSTNKALSRSFSLTGSHGVFKLRPIPGDLDANGKPLTGLERADVDGPVVLNFSGLILQKDNGKKPPTIKKTAVAGQATGGHLAIRRPESSTDYIITMSGGVHLTETKGPDVGTEITMPVVNLQFDAGGGLIKFWGDGEAVATVPLRNPRK